MRKVTSAALLAIKLSFGAALSVILAGLVIQTASVFHWLMPGGVPLQTSFGFETLLESAVEPFGKPFLLALLVCVTIRPAATRGSKTVYTLNRLGLSELQMTLVFGAVFSGYFLLYWAMQLAFAYGVFVWYSQFSLVSSNAFMLAAWRSEWLHLLLPLGEWWGYLRNAVLCLSLGFCAAFGSQLSRHGKTASWAILFPALLCSLMLSGRIGEFGYSILLTVLLIAFTVGYFFAVKGGLEHEDL